jgi:hypothetical protein
MRLRKQTEILRCTVTQEIRQILEPELPEPPDGCYRHVQILVPPSPKIYVTTDQDAAKKFGPNRNYKMPVCPPGAQISMDLMPGQVLFAVAESAYAEVSLVVEYRDCEQPRMS